MIQRLATLLVIVGLGSIATADSMTRLGCDSDCNLDGQVNVDDLLNIISNWGQAGCNTSQIGVDDLLLVISEWNRPCHPFMIDHPLGIEVDFQAEPGFAIIRATGLAEHTMGPFDGSTGCFNPNSPGNQNDEWRIPIIPTATNDPAVSVLDTLGPTALYYNGVALYNPYDGGSMEAPGNICMDDYNGHPSPDLRYHYHQYSPVDGDNGATHSPIVGYGFDGYPIYGPWESNGVLAAQSGNPLDECSGHHDDLRGYHYHSVSYDLGVQYGLPGDGFPWALGCYRGEPEPSNFAGDGGGGGGGGCNGCASVMAPPPVCNCLENIPAYAPCCLDWTTGANGTPDCYAGAATYCGWSP
ncbi:MAG: YHYH protein [Phycisphaerales bacterium]|nr:YHYH protein [Phycisphaerales bacterium]